MPKYNEPENLIQQIKALEARLARVERSSQLANSSVEAGAIGVNNSAGTEVMQVGLQFDDTYAPAVLTGPVPPTPSAPTAITTPGGLLVTYDGTFVGGALSPMDFAHFDVVAGPTGFNPISTPPQVQIKSARGGEVFVPLDVAGEHQVAIITRTLAGTASAASAFATVYVATLDIETSRLVVAAGINNIQPNAQMEEIDPVTPTRPAAWSIMWWVGTATQPTFETASPIQGARSLKLSYAAPTDATELSVPSAVIPVVPGETYYFESKFKSSRASATKVAYMNAWASQTKADNGTIFNSPASIVTSVDSALLSTSSTKLSGTYTIPAGYYWLRLSLNHNAIADAGGAYTITWDDVILISKTINGAVVSTSLDGTGARWEMGTFTGTGRYGDTNQLVGYTTHADEVNPGSINAAASSSAGGTVAEVWMQSAELSTYAGIATISTKTVDPTTGGNYTEVELSADKIRLTGSAMCPANSPEEFVFTDTSTLSVATTTATALSARGGSGVFVAPSSGIVKVFCGGQAQARVAGAYTGIGFEIREGGTVGSGAVVFTIANANTPWDFCLNYAPTLCQVSREYVITGLTPGATYNTRQIARTSDTTAGGLVARGTLVITPAL